MPGMPPSDQQTAPTRGDLAALIALRANQTDAALATITAALINTQQAVAALDARLTAAGIDAEPEIWAATLAAARID